MGNDFFYSDGQGYPWYRQVSNENGEQQKQLSPQETLWELQHLKREFDWKAANYRRMSTAVGSALELFEEAKKLKEDADQRKKEEAEKTAQGQAAGKIKSAYEAVGAQKSQDEFYFLPDGSGSMGGRPITEALKAIGVVQSTAVSANAAPVKAIMWGDGQIKPLDLDLTDPKVIKQLEQGLGCGTDLTVLLETMNNIATSSQTPKHFIVVSDGDLYDPKQSKTAAGQLLGKNSNVSIDFVILTDKGRWGPRTSKTQMQELSDSLQQVFPAQVRTVSVDLDSGNALDAFAGIVQYQLKSSAADVAASKKKQATPAPK